MTTSIQEIYTQVVSTLSPNEQLRLATLILNGIVQQDAAVIDDRDTWTDQDQHALADFSLQHAAAAWLDEEEIAE